MVLHHEGFPIRKSAGQCLFPTHRGLSQVITSFIGSQCQGIHLTLFFAWTAVLLFSILYHRNLKQIQLFCLSFANNCILWVVRSKKTMIFRSYVVLSASRFLSKPTKLFPLLLYGKTFIIFNNKFFSITTICFVSFLYSVFNEHVLCPADRWSQSLLAQDCPFTNHSSNMCLYLARLLRNTCSIEARVIRLVGPSGLEPPTSCLSGTRSNLLSYEPMWLVSDFLFHLNFILHSAFCILHFNKGSITLPLLMSALSYFPVQSPVKYFHHCRA